MSDPLDDIRQRDELLQILYWFRGEGLGDTVAPRELQTFLGIDAETIRHRLGRLVEVGYAAVADPDLERFRLTEWGVKEGGRRFADEFAGLTGQAHGECNNPNCACQTEGPQACEARVAHAH